MSVTSNVSVQGDGSHRRNVMSNDLIAFSLSLNEEVEVHQHRLEIRNDHSSTTNVTTQKIKKRRITAASMVDPSKGIKVVVGTGRRTHSATFEENTPSCSKSPKVQQQQELPVRELQCFVPLERNNEIGYEPTKPIMQSQQEVEELEENKPLSALSGGTQSKSNYNEEIMNVKNTDSASPKSTSLIPEQKAVKNTLKRGGYQNKPKYSKKSTNDVTPKRNKTSPIAKKEILDVSVKDNKINRPTNNLQAVVKKKPAKKPNTKKNGVKTGRVMPIRKAKVKSDKLAKKANTALNQTVLQNVNLLPKDSLLKAMQILQSELTARNDESVEGTELQMVKSLPYQLGLCSSSLVPSSKHRQFATDADLNNEKGNCNNFIENPSVIDVPLPEAKVVTETLYAPGPKPTQRSQALVTAPSLSLNEQLAKLEKKYIEIKEAAPSSAFKLQQLQELRRQVDQIEKNLPICNSPHSSEKSVDSHLVSGGKETVITNENTIKPSTSEMKETGQSSLNPSLPALQMITEHHNANSHIYSIVDKAVIVEASSVCNKFVAMPNISSSTPSLDGDSGTNVPEEQVNLQLLSLQPLPCCTETSAVAIEKQLPSEKEYDAEKLDELVLIEQPQPIETNFGNALGYVKIVPEEHSATSDQTDNLKVGFGVLENEVISNKNAAKPEGIVNLNVTEPDETMNFNIITEVRQGSVEEPGKLSETGPEKTCQYSSVQEGKSDEILLSINKSPKMTIVAAEENPKKVDDSAQARAETLFEESTEGKLPMEILKSITLEVELSKETRSFPMKKPKKRLNSKSSEDWDTDNESTTDNKVANVEPTNTTVTASVDDWDDNESNTDNKIRKEIVEDSWNPSNIDKLDVDSVDESKSGWNPNNNNNNNNYSNSYDNGRGGNRYNGRGGRGGWRGRYGGGNSYRGRGGEHFGGNHDNENNFGNHDESFGGSRNYENRDGNGRFQRGGRNSNPFGNSGYRNWNNINNDGGDKSNYRNYNNNNNNNINNDADSVMSGDPADLRIRLNNRKRFGAQDNPWKRNNDNSSEDMESSNNNNNSNYNNEDCGGRGNNNSKPSWYIRNINNTTPIKYDDINNNDASCHRSFDDASVRRTPHSPIPQDASDLSKLENTFVKYTLREVDMSFTDVNQPKNRENLNLQPYSSVDPRLCLNREQKNARLYTSRNMQLMTTPMSNDPRCNSNTGTVYGSIRNPLSTVCYPSQMLVGGHHGDQGGHGQPIGMRPQSIPSQQLIYHPSVMMQQPSQVTVNCQTSSVYMYNCLQRSTWYQMLPSANKIEINQSVDKLIQALNTFQRERTMNVSAVFDIFKLDCVCALLEILKNLGLAVTSSGLLIDIQKGCVATAGGNIFNGFIVPGTNASGFNDGNGNNLDNNGAYVSTTYSFMRQHSQTL